MNIIHTSFALIRKFWMSSVFCIVILILCFMNTGPLPEAPMTNFDKLVHALMFLGLSGAVFFDNTRYLRRATNGRRVFSGSFLFPVLVGGLIEIVQIFLPYRTGDWWDFFYDAVGAMAGFLICLLINRWLRLNSSL